MSFILCIETSTEVCSVALANNGKTLSLFQLPGGNAHASQLHLLVAHAIEQAGIGLNQLQAVAISKGPGSYTGLRVGVSAAKGYCYALNIPLIAINSLQSLAQHCLEKNPVSGNYFLVPMIDARRMEVYTAVFDTELNLVQAVSAQIINSSSYLHLLDQHKLIFFGNGAAKCRDVITHPNAVFMSNLHCSATGLAAPALIAFKQQEFEDLAYFEPFYLKDFVGTTQRKNLI